MNRSWLIMLFPLGLALASVGWSARAAEPKRVDIVALANATWGTSIEQFPAKAGMRSGTDDYNQGSMDIPGEGVVQIIIPRTMAFYLEPTSLRPYAFYFNRSKGLYKISVIWLSGTEQDVLSVLSKRYGSPVKTATNLGMTSYLWEIGETDVELNMAEVELTPK